ncbi:MAG: hypothetical protein LBH89_03795 [Lactococcus lactis]|uniref:Uncharacterized protein n=1 Tax=Lactococcus lactis subsp. lactis TaxID=1360 RepID=A0A0V8D2M3_LACLL|nr:hypothetical protein KF282_0646 [Lactococcus lactis subsp. lactis]MDR0317557.1 hypothetical protein [Lactococcus lactis]
MKKIKKVADRFVSNFFLSVKWTNRSILVEAKRIVSYINNSVSKMCNLYN